MLSRGQYVQDPVQRHLQFCGDHAWRDDLGLCSASHTRDPAVPVLGALPCALMLTLVPISTNCASDFAMYAIGPIIDRLFDGQLFESPGVKRLTPAGSWGPQFLECTKGFARRDVPR